MHQCHNGSRVKPEVCSFGSFVLLSLFGFLGKGACPNQQATANLREMHVIQARRESPPRFLTKVHSYPFWRPSNFKYTMSWMSRGAKHMMSIENHAALLKILLYRKLNNLNFLSFVTVDIQQFVWKLKLSYLSLGLHGIQTTLSDPL